jgi:hypothetical protein
MLVTNISLLCSLLRIPALSYLFGVRRGLHHRVLHNRHPPVSDALCYAARPGRYAWPVDHGRSALLVSGRRQPGIG